MVTTRLVFPVYTGSDEEGRAAPVGLPLPPHSGRIPPSSFKKNIATSSFQAVLPYKKVESKGKLFHFNYESMFPDVLILLEN